MKKEVTYSEYLQLEGLMTLGRMHVKQVDFIERALVDIVGEPETGGHCGDALWEETSAIQLLAKLNIPAPDLVPADQKADQSAPFQPKSDAKGNKND